MDGSREVAVVAAELAALSGGGITEWWLVTSCRLRRAICVSTPWNVLLFSSPIWFVSAQFTWSFSHNKQVVKLGTLHFPVWRGFFWPLGTASSIYSYTLVTCGGAASEASTFLNVYRYFPPWGNGNIWVTSGLVLRLRKMRRCVWDARHREGLWRQHRNRALTASFKSWCLSTVHFMLT